MGHVALPVNSLHVLGNALQDSVRGVVLERAPPHLHARSVLEADHHRACVDDRLFHGAIV